MDGLPEELLSGILDGLPPRSLAACRGVCHDWCAAIDGRGMLLDIAHLVPHGLRGIYINFVGQYLPYFFSPEQPTNPRIDAALDFMQLQPWWGNGKVLDHRNGLLLYTNDSATLYVCNPATRRWAELPTRPFSDRRGSEYLMFDPIVSLNYDVLFFQEPPLEHRPMKDDVESLFPNGPSFGADWKQRRLPDRGLGSMAWPPVSYSVQVFSSRTGLWEEKRFVREEHTPVTVSDVCSCKNMTDYSTSKTIHVHLLQNGFMPSYNCWTKHGERGIILEDNEEEEDSDNYPMFTEDGDSRMGEDEAEEEPIFDEPIFDDPDDDLGRAILDAKISCGSEKERLKLEKMLEDHKTLLYPNCEDGQKKLGTTLELLQWKAENGTSDKGFEKLLKIIKKMLPGENVLPSSTYEAKKVVCPLGLEVQKIHACINDCILYRGEYENLNACPVCSALRYKIRRDDPGDVEGESTPRKRVPAKVMWPEGSISKGYGTEEVIEFCVDFIPDLKPIGVPESRYEGRLRGKGTLGKKAITCMDGHSFTQAHYTVLHNSILVAPYKEEHKDILRSKYPEEREDWIDGEHMKTFGGWLQTRLMNATDDEQLYLLAKQPSSTISTFQGYEINGNTFYMIAQDKKSTNQNSGVRFDAADDNGKKVTYYGYIEEIWELEYGPNFKVPLFRANGST
ncbi:hypothetical protein QYE76_057286 [Lolium multiflorum]|uniref:F-box domain-containing protein n=1 Tax=Lolium multiflorum TaxID=4521 RepID=A0AAD8WNM9_LOLMU|nr:hypothetical protein QYE76_057286 [Lolium multiflorum]